MFKNMYVNFVLKIHNKILVLKPKFVISLVCNFVCIGGQGVLMCLVVKEKDFD